MENPVQHTFFRYLTYSDEDEQWEMVCTDAGYTEVPPYTIYPPNKEGHPRIFQRVAVGRTLNEYQIIYITKGEGVFETSGRHYDVKPGSIIMVFPGVRHFYKPVYEIGWMEYWVGFKGGHFELLRERGFLNPQEPFIEIGLQNNVLDLYNEIIAEVRDQKPLYQIVASSKILALIAEINACARRRAQASHAAQVVEAAKCMMVEKIYGDIDINSIATALGISASRLNDIFKTYTSMTPYQYYIHIKIHAAKSLLEQGDLSVKEVAYRLGFEDQYHFSRLFKKKTGIAPSQWRAFMYE
ncbi:Transcriptional regulator [uncultured spirochete]|jgi:AraC-like DNA-binding protein|uniref:Transcriptional regulator n=1 Tax=uncultured spirochete TaxID=156406 RepID=A0A3P3XIC7_9SPIR|nr:AraC family transcriptional regulator [Rectinema subterraneum]SLM12716.1 Transcriptional regulator [uncultured spirochete]HCX96537.1 AraC family transcriptional regulator [Spirochaetaceae bacterium]